MDSSRGDPKPVPAGDGRKRRTEVLVAAIILTAGLAGAGVILWAMASSPGTGWSPAWNPSWNPSFGTVQRVPSSDFGSLNASATQGAAYGGNDTLWFRGSSVDMVVYMSPADHDMAFVVQGLANPTIHMAAGARVTVTAINMDPDEYHNWALSRTGPPYSSMPMMNSGSMMSMAMLSPASSAGYPSLSMSFSSQAGSYWYLCEVAGHASSGMYGGFVVA